MFSIFKVIRLVSGMNLKPSKCILIPLGEIFSDDLVHKVRDFLSRNIPEWSTFQVVGAGTYLGFGVGPLAGDIMWEKPVQKWTTRTIALSSAKVAPSLGVAQYNSRSVTTLGYIAQIYPPPGR